MLSYRLGTVNDFHWVHIKIFYIMIIKATNEMFDHYKEQKNKHIQVICTNSLENFA